MALDHNPSNNLEVDSHNSSNHPSNNKVGPSPNSRKYSNNRRKVGFKVLGTSPTSTSLITREVNSSRDSSKAAKMTSLILETSEILGHLGSRDHSRRRGRDSSHRGLDSLDSSRSSKEIKGLV